MTTITGKVKKVIFQSSDNNFSIINVKTEDGYKTVKGYNLPHAANITYHFHGEPVQRNGQRYFKAESFENISKDEIKTTDDAVAYLSSGLFRGIGKKTAEDIVSKYGNNAIAIVENQPEKISEIKGIGAKTVCNIKRVLEESKYVQELVKELGQYDISASRCMKLAAIYGENALSIIRKNPYLMVRDLKMPFAETDEIALAMGCKKDADIRLDAAFRHVLNNVYSMGHTGSELQSFGWAVYRLLREDVPKEKINEHCLGYINKEWYRHMKMEFDNKVYEFIFSDKMYHLEKELGKSIRRLTRNQPEKLHGITEKIKEMEDASGFKLDPMQVQAIHTALENPLTVITGGPGTGKTTIMEWVTKLYENEVNKGAILLAPTGKAARKLTEYTRHQAKTIHSWFEVYDISADADDIVAEDIKDRLVVIDEFSMVDTATAHLLLTHIKDGSRVVLVGDIDQLPSVGAGAILRDIIDSNICPVIRLEHIFRTGKESLIHTNTQYVNLGIKNLKRGKDFHMYRESDMDRCRKLLTDIYSERIKEYGIENTVMLLPYRKDVGGVDDMNIHLQGIINPPAENKAEVKVGKVMYRVGDPVMHVKCNTPEVCNGDTGRIVDVVNVDGLVQVVTMMNGRRIVYEKEDLTNLDLAYAMTIHKSQGSEYKSVITCITNNQAAMLYRNIPYVAFSRGKEVVDVVYDTGLYKAIETKKSDNRITLLPYFLS